MKKLAYLAIFLSLVLPLGGCALLPPLETAAPPTSPTATTPVAPMDSTWTLSPGNGQAPFLPNIADVVAKVKPSVVAINTEVVGYDFFNRPFTQPGAGSGWIIRQDGVIVTNNHVVEGAQNITVTLDDGRTFSVDPGKVAIDPLADLAVLKIDATNLPAVTLGDSSKLRVGDWVVAIGNSLGQGITAKEGIISRKGVPIPVDSGQTLYDLLETSAAINPGNSGGPLANMAGEVIGITSAKIASAGVEGMGYAIPSEEAAAIIQQLVNTGYVVRPWMGVGLTDVTQFVVRSYNLGVDSGALITNVASGSPADRAGIKVGDVITTFDSQPITEVNGLLRALHSSKVGRKVTITYWRGRAQANTEVTLIESPPPS
ncbi:MAG: trypsin-like peptidase domain-containing protein [Chloroflexota bacterium]